MAYLKKDLTYWREKYPELLEELKDLYSDVDHPMICDTFSRNDVISTKPDIISEDLWDNFFLKDKRSLDNALNRIGESTFLFLEIEDITFAFFYNSPSICVAFSRSVSGNLEESIEFDSIIDRKTQPVTNRSWSSESRDLNQIFNIAEEFYGEGNVVITNPFFDTHFSGIHVSSGMNKPYIIIKHDDFWVEDKYGLRMKVIYGMTAIRFARSGTFDSGSGSISFGCTMRDQVSASGNIAHPHVPGISSVSYITFKSVCRGSNSPINSALNSYVSNKTDENAFNLLLNYQNLLHQEDEEGTPHIRMRDAWLKRARSSVNVRKMSNPDIYDGIEKGIIDIITNTYDNSFEVKINEDTIADYIEEQAESSDQGVYLHKPNGRTYKKEVRDISCNPETYCHIPFNGEMLPVGVCNHDPTRFDMSAMDEREDVWKSSTLEKPDSITIKQVNDKIQSIINFKLISENDDESITKEDIKEELLGIKEIRRNSNIGDIVTA